MGKKTKEPNQGPSDTINALFSADNPFRRKPQPTFPPPTPPTLPPEAAELGLGSESAIDVKKRKRDKKSGSPNSNSSTPESIPKKRKKVESGDEEKGENLRKKNKRKRDEVEEEYEKRKYGEIVEKEESVAVNVGEKRKAKDVVASEMVVSKEEEEAAFDDESKLLRTVFVGNLPLKIKKKVLVKEFERFGGIESVRIRSVPLVDSKTPRKGAIIKGKVNEAVGRVHAYIVFNDEQSVHAALSHNMSQIGGNHIRVDMACPPRKRLKGETPLYDRKRTVFVGNLPFDLKDEELYKLFCGSDQSESSFEAVRVVRDPQTSFGKGIAYVLFKNRDAPNSVVKRRDLMIRDRALRFCHAKSDATPSKRKDSGSKQDFPRKKFAVASNEIFSSSGMNDKPKAASASLSYQGLRSSKSGVVKKSSLHSHSSGHGNHGTKMAGGADKKARKAKRPAVAARNAQLMKKRNLESGTPENAHRHKKVTRQ